MGILRWAGNPRRVGTIISHVFWGERLNLDPSIFTSRIQSGMLRWNTGSSHVWVRETWHFWANRRYNTVYLASMLTEPNIVTCQNSNFCPSTCRWLSSWWVLGTSKKKLHTLPTFDGMVFERISLKEKTWGKFFHLIDITTGIVVHYKHPLFRWYLSTWS